MRRYWYNSGLQRTESFGLDFLEPCFAGPAYRRPGEAPARSVASSCCTSGCSGFSRSDCSRYGMARVAVAARRKRPGERVQERRGPGACRGRERS